MSIAQAQMGKSVIYKEIEASIKLKSNTKKLKPFKWLSNDGISNTLLYKPKSISQSATGDLLEIIIPMSSKESLTLILKEEKILNLEHKRHQLKTYRGIIKGNQQSWATLNISGTSINGIIADEYGNTIIEQRADGTIEVYNSNNKHQEAWLCGTPSEANDDHNKSNSNLDKRQSEGDTISLYVDCDYALYKWQGSDVSQTINYVNSLINDVAAIYKNEHITLVIEDIHVWTTMDSYNKQNTRRALYDFQDHLNGSFDADLAILLSAYSELSGGLAFVNSLCQKKRAYSYANLRSSVTSNSSYYWQTHVVAHELGHNLGSPHTHDCKWGPDGNQALDKCFPNSCDLAPAAESGTIMSYCHLSSNNGVNLAKGFGQESGDTIRARIANCRGIFGKNCDTAINLSIGRKDTIILAPGPKLGDGASQSDTEHATWYHFAPVWDGFLSVNSCSKGVDTRLHIHLGSCEELDRIAYVDDNCNMGNYLRYASRLDSVAVIGGQSYYIEWDNRWSTNSFEFLVRYDYATVDLCNNGVLDEGEEDIDCGGTACTACSSCEHNSSVGSNYVSTTSEMRSNSAVTYQGVISMTGDMLISSAESITFEAGFEISQGGLLNAMIESCAEYLERITAASKND